MTTLPDLPVYPTELEVNDPDGDRVREDYLAVITNAIANHPRSLQKKIGPSEVAHPCARRIGYKLLDVPETNVVDDIPWRPTVGTAVHAWEEEQFTAANEGHDRARWLTEMRVSVGTIGGVDITGSSDLYDQATGTVVDHKIVGPASIRKYKSQRHPGPQYRGQIHLYGRGFTRRGLDVRRVMIAFLPSAGELRDAYFWSEPYDEQIALDALQRAEGIHTTLQAVGPHGLNLLPTADAYCSRCPWFNRTGAASPGTPRDATTSCSGHPAGDQERRADPVLALI